MTPSIDRGFCTAATTLTTDATRQIVNGSYPGARGTLGALIDLTTHQRPGVLGALQSEMIVVSAQRFEQQDRPMRR